MILENSLISPPPKKIWGLSSSFVAFKIVAIRQTDKKIISLSREVHVDHVSYPQQRIITEKGYDFAH